MRSWTLGLVMLAATATAAPAMAQSRDTIQIAGSSTVLPFASVVAEEFGNAFPQYKTPVVGSGGTGGGMRQFCQGVGTNTIDIANASRPISSKEIASCADAGVTQIIPVRFGYDGIVFASRADKGNFKLTPAQLFAAIAGQVVQNGEKVSNPYTSWDQIDPSLPNQPITLVIPGTNHGTREVFEENVIVPGCESYRAVEEMPEDEREQFCLNFRQDGRVIEIAGDYTESLARLDANQDAVGVFGLSFYDQNRDKLQVATIDGVEPSPETIASGEYPVSRPLFFYIKGQHIGQVPGLEEYAKFFLSEQMSGEGSQLVEMGLIPLSEEERDQQMQNVEEKKTVES